MKKLGAIAILSAALMSPVVYAQFTSGMTASQLQQEVQAQVAAGKSAADIARAGLAAGVEAGSLTTAMLLAGINPNSALTALLVRGGQPGRGAGCGAGGGRFPRRHQYGGEYRRRDASASGPIGSGPGTGSGLTGGPSGPSGSGGGGTASTR